MLSVPCHHGAKLPELGEGRACWNGKSWFAELASLRPVRRSDGFLDVFRVVKCRHCEHQWRFEWADIWEFINDKEMQARLRLYVGAELKAKADEHVKA